MAFNFLVNQAPLTGSIAIFNLKERLKAINWAVLSSGDATTYNSTGDQITSGSTGASGMANTNAWFRIRCPLMGGVNREFCIQRGSSNVAWRIKYSYSSSFTGGSPSATRTPSATDEQYICGGGTDASPTFATIFGTDASYKHHIGYADGDDGYMFYSVCYGHNAGSLSHLFYMDQLQQDSVSQADVDGYMFFAGTSSSRTTSHASASGLNGPQGWYRKNLSNETFTIIPTIALSLLNNAGATVSAEQALGVNAWDSKDTGMPAIYARLNSENGNYSGFKGIGRLFKISSSARNVGSTLSLNTTRDKIQIERFIFPWNGDYSIL